MDMITFKNEQDDGTLKIGAIVLIVIIIGGAARLIYSNEFVKSRGILNDLIFMVLLGLVITAFVYFLLLIKDVFCKNINIGNNQKDSATNINEDRERLKIFFKEDTFEEFKRIFIEEKMISEQGKWIFSSRKRDCSILILKLIDSKIIKISDNEIRQFHKAFQEYFSVNFDYPLMTTVIKEGYGGLSEKDKESYHSFSFIDRIKV